MSGFPFDSGLAANGGEIAARVPHGFEALGRRALVLTTRAGSMASGPVAAFRISA
jgi:hypothetical protein